MSRHLQRAPGILLAAVLAGACAPAHTDTAAVAWEEPVPVAQGGGDVGPWRMNDSEFLYVDDPAVAVNEAGVVGVVWADNAAKDVFVQIFGGDGGPRLAIPTNVSRSPDTFSWLPRLLVGTADGRELFVLWQEIVFSGGSHGGEIYFARSVDGGASFSAPLNLSNTPAGAGKGRLSATHWSNGSLDLARGPGGEIYAAWTEYEGRLWISRSSDGGDSFSVPLRIAGDERRPARGPSLAVTADGTVHLAWSVGEDPAADIHLARSGDSGRSFSAPRLLHPGPGHADAPRLAVDGLGGIHLVYAESFQGPGQRYRVRYTRSMGGGDEFQRPRTLSTHRNAGADSAHYPAIATAGEAGVYVLWELFPDWRRRPQGLGFTVSRDGGGRFAPAAPVPGSGEPAPGVNGSLQGLLMRKLAVNDAGRIAVVNSRFNPGHSSHIRLHLGRHGPGPVVASAD